MTEASETKIDTPAIGVSLNVAMSLGRTLVFQTHVPQDISEEGLEAMVRKLQGVADRQWNKYDLMFHIEELTKLEEQQALQHNNFLGDFERLETVLDDATEYKKRTNVQNAQLEQQRKSALVTLGKGLEAVELTRRKLAEAKVKLADMS